MFQFEWKNKAGWKRCPKPAKVPACPDDKKVVRTSLLLWEEHCVECSAPQCYQSCTLYADRGDGNCQRFSYGIYPNNRFRGLFNYGADIHFKRWAKLEAGWPLKPALHSVKKIRCLAVLCRVHEFVFTTVLKCLPRGTRLFNRVLYELSSRKPRTFELLNRMAMARPKNEPDALYIKLFSPGPVSCNLQLELMQDEPVYRNNLKVVPGWNEYTVPYAKLNFAAGKERYLRLWIDRDQEVRLIFTWLDLVKFKSLAPATPAGSAEKVKCVAWDLDNTLWKGVIGDDGKDGVQVVPEALELIRKLDQRGIIQTVVSKNEHATAWEKIVELELDKYFLYPAINWDPKSANILRIAKELNINVNSFALLDDSVFEREEVAAACPQVRTYDPAVMSRLLDNAEFDVPVTKEASQRRLKYLEDIKRKSVEQTWSGDLDDFLRDCSIELNIRPIHNQEQINRCLELLQRSNQFNLSGKRYSADEFAAHLRNHEYDSYALDVQDRYGDYGIVGFVSVQRTSEAVIATDFVMSCRVARKKVENAFFHWYLNRKECLGKAAYARMKVTGRNQPLRQVFNELMFEVVTETDTEVMMQVDPVKIGRCPPPILIQAAETLVALPAVDSGASATTTRRFEYPLQVSVVSGRDLTAEQIKVWSAIQSATPELESPFFRPEFTQAVAQATENIQVGILRDATGTEVGFFPFQLVRPGGGKNLEICDYQGVIAPPALEYNAKKLIKSCGLKVWEFDHLMAKQTAFLKYHYLTTESPVINVLRNFDDYKESLNPEGKRHLAKARSVARKAQRELGPLRFVYNSPEAQVMQAMHQWRAEKYGPLAEWSHQALEKMRTANTPGFAGVLSALYAGEKLLAVHFGIRSRSVLHWWFPAYNPEFSSYAPGILLLLNMVERGPELGITKIDLGKGMQDYKRRFRNASNTVASGSVELLALNSAPRILRENVLYHIRTNPKLRNLANLTKRIFD